MAVSLTNILLSIYQVLGVSHLFHVHQPGHEDPDSCAQASLHRHLPATLGYDQLFCSWGVSLYFWTMLSHLIILSNVNIDLTLCQGYEDDPDSVTDAIKSFPSGHAQISCFAAAFTIVSYFRYQYSYSGVRKTSSC